MQHHTGRVSLAIVGGGVAGLALAREAALRGYKPVVFEQEQQVGGAASGRNHGWLQSGALYAVEEPLVAAQCWDAYQRTKAFCPECIEPADRALLVVSDSRTDPELWKAAWREVGIPFQEIDQTRACRHMPALEFSPVLRAFLTEDCPVRPDRLLAKLREDAEQHGAQFRPAVQVSRLILEDGRVSGLGLADASQIETDRVVLACGAWWNDQLLMAALATQGRHVRPPVRNLKTHLMALTPPLGPGILALLDADQLNHVPHEGWSIIGNSQCEPASSADDLAPQPDKLQLLTDSLTRFFPLLSLAEHRTMAWAGVLAEAAPAARAGIARPRTSAARSYTSIILDHARPEHGGLQNLFSVFPGRLTLWPIVAERAIHCLEDQRLGEENQAAPALPQWVRLAAHPRPSVLVVESDSIHAELLREYLNPDRFERPCFAKDARHALELLHRAEPFNLLLVDVPAHQPHAGLDLLREARARCPAMGILATSFLFEEGSPWTHQALEAGADACLEKPFGSKELEDRIAAVQEASQRRQRTTAQPASTP